MTNHQIYVRSVLNFYLQMPGVPHRVCPNDRALASQWFTRQVPIPIVEAALLLGACRRLRRSPDAPKLAPIRSMAYFGPAVEELVAQPPPPTYIHYLRFKLGFAGLNTG